MKITQAKSGFPLAIIKEGEQDFWGSLTLREADVVAILDRLLGSDNELDKTFKYQRVGGLGIDYASRLGLELLGEADGLKNICIEPEQGSPTYDGMLKQEGYVFLITGLNAIHTKASQSKGEMNVSVKGIVYKDGKVVGGINNSMIEVDDFYKLISPDSQFRLSSDTIQGLPVFETKLKFKMGGNGN